MTILFLLNALFECLIAVIGLFQPEMLGGPEGVAAARAVGAASLGFATLSGLAAMQGTRDTRLFTAIVFVTVHGSSAMAQLINAKDGLVEPQAAIPHVVLAITFMVASFLLRQEDE